MTTLKEWRRQAEVMAELRTRLTGDPTHPDAVAEQCETCPTVFYRSKGRRRHHCPKCKAERMVAGAGQMQARSGPAYEAWLWKTRDHVNRELVRLGLITAGSEASEPG